MMRREFRLATGFTITELVVVIVIAAILAAIAISRVNTTSFNATGYANQVSAAIRYAQKIAVSQRRNVRVTVSGSSVSLTYPDLGQPVRKPPDTDPFTLSIPSNVTLGGTLPSSFTFSPLGRPDAGGTLTVSGGDIPTITITVEVETGYVH